MEEETEVVKTMGKKEFWLRFSLWIIFAVAVPVGFLFFKYGLFSTESHTKLTGWGVFALIIVAVVMMILVKDVIKGLPDGSLIKQCAKGFLALIPLILVLLLVHSVKNSIEQFEEFLVVLVISEAVAVPLNPLPKWGAQNRIDMQKKTFGEVSRGVVDYFFKKSKE